MYARVHLGYAAAGDFLRLQLQLKRERRAASSACIMEALRVEKDLSDFHLDVLGQNPFLKIYTHICSCYSAQPSAYGAVITTLEIGLQRLSDAFPWLAGQVFQEDSAGVTPGIFKIKPLEKTIQLVVKDMRNDPLVPSMDAMRQADFPMNMLDESIVAPRNTIPTPEEDAAPDAGRVFIVQATYIKGGLILDFAGKHNVMDMTGQGQIIKLLSKACRNEAFSEEELTSGNLSRRNLVPLIKDYVPGPELDLQRVQANPVTVAEPVPTKVSWASFNFPAGSLEAIKAEAAETVTSPPGYISTDDALTAFIWQATSRARLPRLHGDVPTMLARAVDARRYLGVPDTYTGMLQNMTYIQKPRLQKLIDQPLGAVASELRSAVDPKSSSLAYHSRSVITFFSTAADKLSLSFTAAVNPSTGAMISSWSKVDLYALDFGLGLGTAEAVRRPRFVPYESLIYLMPKRPGGELNAAICLRDEDLERMRGDEQFARHATFVG
jgi:hypothetical protein